jgi:hypothetical protein
MKAYVAVIALLLISMASVARADADGSAIARPASDRPAPRSPRRAIAISALGTMGSLALIGAAAGITAATPGGNGGDPVFFLTLAGATGFLIAPSLGHVYGEDRWWTTGAKLRVAGVSAALVGGYSWAASLATAEGDPTTAAKIFGYGGIGVFSVGCALLLGGVIHDIATAGSATERYNRNIGLSLSVTPMVIRTASNQNVGGLGLAGRF